MSNHPVFDISHLKPNAIWQYFADICRIPRVSKKEEAITAFVKNIGEKHRLETEVDKVGNVVIRKPATLGMKNRKGVILQCHLDMVSQKEAEVVHDFEKDPIQPYLEEGWVKAKGTTLGADNGIGVATALAILESQDIQHGPLEVLLTVDEECGMSGAIALKPQWLKGSILLNLDSELEGIACIGCAGGGYTDATLDYQTVATPKDTSAYHLHIMGLKGGHSGCDIHLGRANAIKLLTRLCFDAQKSFGLRLSSISSQNPRNAIPLAAEALVIIPNQQKSVFLDYVQQFENAVKQEFAGAEDRIQVQCKPHDWPDSVLDEKSQYTLLRALYACPHGVIFMSKTLPGLTETSTNLAYVHTANGKIDIHTLQRSAFESAKKDVMNQVQAVFELAQGKILHGGEYPGWTPNTQSPILSIVKTVYQKIYQKPLKVEATHGGLECGLFSQIYPHWDMISIGPTILYAHSPLEKVNIESVGHFWDFLLEILRSIPER